MGNPKLGKEPKFTKLMLKQRLTLITGIPLSEASRRFNIPRTSILNLIRNGTVKRYRAWNGRVYLSLDSIERHINTR